MVLNSNYHMKNDIKSKNFLVIRRYKPPDDDFFDDNPNNFNNNNNNHNNHNNHNHNHNHNHNNDNDYFDDKYNDKYNDNDNINIKFGGSNISKNYDQDTTHIVQSQEEDNESQNFNNNLLNISDIDISSLVVNFELNLNIFDPYQTYSDYTDNAYTQEQEQELDQYYENSTIDDITFNFFG